MSLSVRDVKRLLAAGIKAEYERTHDPRLEDLDGVIGGYRFYLVLFRCTVCGFAFEGGCSFARDAHRLQRNIAAWNRICNGSEKFTLYESLGGRR